MLITFVIICDDCPSIGLIFRRLNILRRVFHYAAFGAHYYVQYDVIDKDSSPKNYKIMERAKTLLNRGPLSLRRTMI